jgi:hypothetical protein
MKSQAPRLMGLPGCLLQGSNPTSVLIADAKEAAVVWVVSPLLYHTTNGRPPRRSRKWLLVSTQYDRAILTPCGALA